MLFAELNHRKQYSNLYHRKLNDMRLDTVKVFGHKTQIVVTVTMIKLELSISEGKHQATNTHSKKCTKVKKRTVSET